MVNVFLAFSKDETAQKIRRMLSGSSYEVSGICHTAAELIRSASQINNAAVIMSYNLPDGTLSDTLPQLNCPVIAIIRPDDAELIADESVFTLPLPLNRSKLISAADMCFGPIIRRMTKSKRSAQDDRIIKQAKLMLMENNNMTEDQAYRFIQKRSMDTGSKFVDTAKMILNI